MMTVADATSRADADHLPFFRVFMAIAGIYVAQSLVSGLALQSIPAVMRSSGAALDQLGLLYLVLVPWTLKFLWAPWLERIRLGGARNRSREIIIIGQWSVAALIAGIAFVGTRDFPILLAALSLAALAAATIDIACDGFAVEQLAAHRRGWGNTAQVGGSYIGFMLGGGVYLWLMAQSDFKTATFLLAALLVALSLPFAFIRLSRHSVAGAHGFHTPSLGFALKRREVILGILLVMLAGVGPRMGSSLLGPYLIDKGLDLGTLGILNGVAAVGAGVTGTFLGALLVQAFGAGRATVIAIAVQALALFVLVGLAFSEAASLAMIIGVQIGLATAMALGFVAIYSLLMGASSLRQAGVDFTLFQCADAAASTVSGLSAGVIAHAIGYTNVFGIAAGSAVIALLASTFLTRRIEQPEGHTP
jgi:MFS transporter (putative signal transducer)